MNNKYEDYNKVIVKMYVTYYAKYWFNWYTITNEEIKQRARFETWYHNLIIWDRNDPHPEVWRYIRKHEINPNTTTRNMLKTWGFKYKEFKGKIEKPTSENDIRQFFLFNN